MKGGDVVKVNNTFQRVEKKYSMSKEQYDDFKEMTKPYICQDQFGLHTISNIYFDTDTYDLIRNSIEGPRYKEKFRIRGYGKVTDETNIFLEIKKKYNGIVYKRRMELPYVEAIQFLDCGKLEGHNNQIYKEIEYFFQFYKPKPKLFLAYDRVAYIGIENSELRITIDQNIRSRSERLVLSAGDDGEILDGRRYLMEIKVQQSYPIWLVQILSKLEIYPISFSKYGTIYKHAVKNHMLEINNEQMEQKKEAQEVLELDEEDKQICLQAYSAM